MFDRIFLQSVIVALLASGSSLLSANPSPFEEDDCDIDEKPVVECDLSILKQFPEIYTIYKLRDDAFSVMPNKCKKSKAKNRNKMRLFLKPPNADSGHLFGIFKDLEFQFVGLVNDGGKLSAPELRGQSVAKEGKSEESNSATRQTQESAEGKTRKDNENQVNNSVKSFPFAIPFDGVKRVSSAFAKARTGQTSSKFGAGTLDLVEILYIPRFEFIGGKGSAGGAEGIQASGDMQAKSWKIYPITAIPSRVLTDAIGYSEGAISERQDRPAFCDESQFPVEAPVSFDAWMERLQSIGLCYTRILQENLRRSGEEAIMTHEGTSSSLSIGRLDAGEYSWGELRYFDLVLGQELGRKGAPNYPSKLSQMEYMGRFQCFWNELMHRIDVQSSNETELESSFRKIPLKSQGSVN